MKAEMKRGRTKEKKKKKKKIKMKTRKTSARSTLMTNGRLWSSSA